MKTALYWQKKSDKVQCSLCPHFCLIREGSFGICRVRINSGGTLVSSVYKEITSIAIDPIEKKPLNHFYPGSKILSVGTNGCNLSCEFCQNWEISQNADSGRRKISSEEIIIEALETGSIGIAFTYNEPFIWYEFVLETAKKAKKAGLKNVLVTNGYVNEEPLLNILPYIDAMNIDLKSFNKDFYSDICNGDVKPVLKTITKSFGKCHIELTNLLIPGKNDKEKELKGLAEWVAGISAEIPVHLSRYFGNYKMKGMPTGESSLIAAREILLKKLNFVYIGNITIEETGKTNCPECNNVIIDRTNYAVKSIKVVDGKCGYCGRKVYGLFN